MWLRVEWLVWTKFEGNSCNQYDRFQRSLWDIRLFYETHDSRVPCSKQYWGMIEFWGVILRLVFMKKKMKKKENGWHKVKMTSKAMICHTMLTDERFEGTHDLLDWVEHLCDFCKNICSVLVEPCNQSGKLSYHLSINSTVRWCI